MSITNYETRDKINDKYKWNIESMYSNNDDWEKDYEKALSLSETFPVFSGKLSNGSNVLVDAFKTRDMIWQIAEKVYVYARMKRDENNEIATYQAMTDKCHTLISKISSNMSFFTPELLSIEENVINKFISDTPELSIYKHLIYDTLRQKEHILSEKEENILAKTSQLNSSTNDVFTMLNNADLSFGEIVDENGNKVKLTHGNYINFMESQSRSVRKNAFENMYSSYKSLINTISTTYNYNTKTDVVLSGIRKYPSALESSLSSDNIDKKVYTNLIETVNKSLPSLHKYIKTRKRLLGNDNIYMYDMYVPLIKIPDKEITFDDSVEIMKKALSPLGEDYIKNVSEGIKNRWIDVYESKGKTSGAYSFGSYDSMPFILLNFSGKLKDVFTLVHEMGHSMHSFYTRKNQPFIYGGHSIFTAEVASTVNESLLMHYLLENAENDNMKKYLLNTYIEGFRTTLFRQTMFAEFELLTHQEVENGGVLTSEWLSSKYNELNKKYFGDALSEDSYIQYEWARIPHFYNAFYVYKYATGYSAATAISSKIISEGESARNNYLEFLKTGESDYPIELLKIAGVDMSTSEPIELAMKTFNDLVDEFNKLV